MALGVVYAQSLVDILSHGETLTRFMLWVQVAGLHTTCVVFVILFLFPSTRPEHQLKTAWNLALDEVLQQLDALKAGKLWELELDAVEQGVANRRRLFAFAAQDPAFAKEQGWHLARTTTVERLHLAAVHFSSEDGCRAGAEALQTLGRVCEVLKDDLAKGRPFRMDPEMAAALASLETLPTPLREMADALSGLADAETRPFPPQETHREKLLAPDAFSNPAHVKFAVRTVLAAMICYVFYTAVEWPGIHTAMLTCIIMALPPLGSSSLGGVSHKGLVRVVGALLGSGLALFCTVFILPRLDGLTGLLAMVLPVIAGAAWITAGSAKSNYVGRQIMFTFVLALLGRFSLTPDIPEIRDRIVGILLGVGVYIALATVLWPDREGTPLRSKLAALLRNLADLARLRPESEGIPGQDPPDLHRAKCWELLGQCRDLQTRVALEPGAMDLATETGLDLERGIAEAQRTLGAIHWMQVQLRQPGPGTPVLEARLENLRASAADRLDGLAGALERNPAQTLPFPSWPEAKALAEKEPEAREILRAVQALQDAIAQLGAHLLPAAPQLREEP